jgi:hypothetical protein
MSSSSYPPTEPDAILGGLYSLKFFNTDATLGGLTEPDATLGHIGERYTMSSSSAILYSDDHEVRRVRMNEPHPAHVMPFWYGDSVGHYEGDTLVVDTVGIKIGPYAMVDWYGTPYTKALHVVERYRLLDYDATIEAEKRGERENSRIEVSGSTGFSRDPAYKGKGLQLEFTVEDEGAFTMPWSATITYRRPLGEWAEVVCAENPYELGRNVAVPTADNLDF